MVIAGLAVAAWVVVIGAVFAVLLTGSGEDTSTTARHTTTAAQFSRSVPPPATTSDTTRAEPPPATTPDTTKAEPPPATTPDTTKAEPPPAAETRSVAPPPPPVTRIAPAPAQSSCHPSYDPCLPIVSDVDCAGGSGNGPVYTQGPVRVIGPDEYGLDRDRDGVGCE
ncbi:hypothetical protein [Nocardia sp. CC227C]|uniref:hypothetical protein n=1 Tax=Nocardia sp. CC227C TaxID=3044562 RepID=UPI00278BF715|nr:hypothetical protein [Nocardia sp. CC227C]